jgi:uncharacterized protein YndB with AHSA1/START domain
MVDILHGFPVAAPPEQVFAAVSSPEGLDSWWTNRCVGAPSQGAEYELYFGPGYDWRARVSRWQPRAELELEITAADTDWTGTRVGFSLEKWDQGTWGRFWNSGWAKANKHHRRSSFCWTMYLRQLRRYVERGETVAYQERFDA